MIGVEPAVQAGVSVLRYLPRVLVVAVLISSFKIDVQTFLCAYKAGRCIRIDIRVLCPLCRSSME